MNTDDNGILCSINRYKPQRAFWNIGLNVAALKIEFAGVLLRHVTVDVNLKRAAHTVFKNKIKKKQATALNAYVACVCLICK